MANSKPYRFKFDAHQGAQVVLLELFKDGTDKPIGVRSVPQYPSDTFPERLIDAKAWLAWNAGITRHEVKE